MKREKAKRPPRGKMQKDGAHVGRTGRQSLGTG